MTNKGAVTMDKLALINSIEVIESSGTGGELEYVYVSNTFESISILKQIGATDTDISDMLDTDGECIDISAIGFNYTDAIYFSENHGGFITFIPDSAPDWCKEAFTQ